jgi:predicted PurR-regulated permease PerM
VDTFQIGDVKQVLQKFASVMKATVKGNWLIASIQGIIGGSCFWLIGIGAALSWGALTALMSLLRAIGAALVWFPAAVYLGRQGSPPVRLSLFGMNGFVLGPLITALFVAARSSFALGNMSPEQQDT